MMYVSVIHAFDLPDLWYRVIKECLEHGYKRPVFRGARQGAKRLELDCAILHVRCPSNRPLVPDTPEGVPPPTSIQYVNTYLEYLVTPFKKEWEQYTYGERMAGKLGVPEDYGTGFENPLTMVQADMVEGQRVSAIDVNQLDVARQILKETPESNRAMIEIGKPEDILLRHPPCMRILQFKVRYGKLHLWTYFRSWDAWSGLPANLAALQLVKEFIAKDIEVDDGEIFAMSAGLHIYNDVWDLAEIVVGGGKHRKDYHSADNRR